MKTKFKMHDTVIDMFDGKGKIIYIAKDTMFPIKVKFENGERREYKLDGSPVNPVRDDKLELLTEENDRISNGYYLIEPKNNIKYLGEKAIVLIYNANKNPDYCVTLFGDETQYSLKNVKIIRKLDLNRL